MRSRLLNEATTERPKLQPPPPRNEQRRPETRSYDQNLFGCTIRRLRLEAGLSLGDVAPYVRGVRGKPVLPAYLNQIETGHVHPTRRANAAMIPSLAAALGCDENELWNAV